MARQHKLERKRKDWKANKPPFREYTPEQVEKNNARYANIERQKGNQNPGPHPSHPVKPSEG